MLIGQLALVEFLLELTVEYALEDILEAAVIDLEDRVLGGEVDGEIPVQAIVEGRPGEILDRVVQVIHGHGNACAWGVEHLVFDDLAVLAEEPHGELSLPGELEIGGAILIAISMTADDDRFGPAGHEPRHVRADDRLAENHASENVANGAVGRLPHLLEAELLHALLVGRDGCAFHPDAMLFYGMRGFDRDLVLRAVTVLNREVVIEKVDVEIGVDKLLLDQGPDNPRHLIAIQFDERVLNLDLCHVSLPPFFCR